MEITLLSCDAAKPDRRAIATCMSEISTDMDSYTANELTDILLEGDSVQLELPDSNTSSAFRALRKLGIDYEINE